MKNKVRVILVPEFFPLQIIFDTIDLYCELCNFISEIVHVRKNRQPKMLHYWVVGNNNEKFYDLVCRKFPGINTNLIPLAFLKITNVYNKRWPSRPYTFRDTLDCSNDMISIKSVLQSPHNIGLLSIVTLGGAQLVHFMFNDNQRKELNEAFNREKFRLYQLVYNDYQLSLTTDVYDHKMTGNIADNPIYVNNEIGNIIEELDPRDTEVRYRNELLPTF